MTKYIKDDENGPTNSRNPKFYVNVTAPYEKLSIGGPWQPLAGPGKLWGPLGAPCGALPGPVRPWGLAAGCWQLAASCWLLPAGCWLLAAGCWLLAAGCWLLAAGCWLLAAGCWLLAGWLAGQAEVMRSG